MKTKNFKLSVFMSCLLGLIALALDAPAQSFQRDSFLSGYNLAIIGSGNLQTNYWGQTNVWLKYNALYGPGYANTTNQVIGGGGFGTNSPLNSVNTTNAQALQLVTYWYNRDGTEPKANVAVSFAGNAATSTNQLYFQLIGVPNLYDGMLTATNGNSWAVAGWQFPFNSWGFYAQANGTNVVTVYTNLPSGVFQGCSHIAPQITQPAAQGSGTNIMVVDFSINGFHP
jgi:hypothetical protein